MNKLLILMLILLFSTRQSIAQEEGTEIDNKPACIIFDVKGVLNPGDTLMISLFNTPSYYNRSWERIPAVVKRDGLINFRLNKISNDTKISFKISQIGHPSVNYRVMAGDSVQIAVRLHNNKATSIFSGVGYEKYKCKYLIDSAERAWLQELKDTRAVRGESSVASADTKQITNSFKSYKDRYLKQFAVLQTFSKIIEPEVYALIKADLLGVLHYDIMGSSKLTYGQSKFADSIRLEISRQIEFPLPENEIEKMMFPLSDKFIEGLYAIEYIRMFLNFQSDPSIESKIYIQLKNKYKGVLRDNLLMRHLLGRLFQINQIEFENALVDALTVIENSEKKDILEQHLSKNKIGAQAFNFKLPDESGNYVTLSDYKGKVVLLYFWSATCGFCKKMEAKFREIVIPQLQDNREFHIISINLDKDPVVWRKGIKEAQLKSSVNTHLFSEGLAFNHQLAKYYRVNGTPKMLLLDRDGKIVKSALSQSPGEIIATVQRVLNLK